VKQQRQVKPVSIRMKPSIDIPTPSLTWVVTNSLKDDVRRYSEAAHQAYILWKLSSRCDDEEYKALYAYCSNSFTDRNWTGFQSLHFAIAFHDFSSTLSIVQQGADIYGAAPCLFWSPIKESPTSVSLRSSASFSIWRNVLREENIPLENFITQELQHGHIKSEG